MSFSGIVNEHNGVALRASAQIARRVLDAMLQNLPKQASRVLAGIEASVDDDIARCPQPDQAPRHRGRRASVAASDRSRRRTRHGDATGGAVRAQRLASKDSFDRSARAGQDLEPPEALGASAQTAQGGPAR